MNVSPLSSVIAASGYSSVQAGKPSGEESLSENSAQANALIEVSGTQGVSYGGDSANLGEIEVAAPAVNDMGNDEFSTARLSSGASGIPVKMAASLYVLKHSFDEQKSILQLIA